MLVDPECAGPLVAGDGVRPEDSSHPGAGLPLEFEIGGLDGAGGGDQVGDLRLRRAGPAPDADVLIGGVLDAVLDLADTGVMLAGRCGQRPPGEARVLADLPQAGAQGLPGLPGGARRAVVTVGNRQLPRRLES